MVPPDAEYHARLKKLFFQAIELEEEERREFLNEACAANCELRADLESLLRHHRRSDLTDDSFD